jgi:hypothetical protein
MINRKIRYLFCQSTWIFLVIVAATQAYGQGDYDAGLASCEGIIIFPDPNLAAAVRDEIGLESGDITSEDVEELTFLHGEGRGISDLTNIHCLVNLEVADMIANNISDGGPMIPLTKLTDIVLSENAISDLSFLQSMTQVSYLDLNDNQISDLSPLTVLTNIGHLRLDNNQITNIAPLVENAGLGDGDDVDVRNNPLDCEDEQVLADIQALEDRGIDLENDCTDDYGTDTDTDNTDQGGGAGADSDAVPDEGGDSSCRFAQHGAEIQSAFLIRFLFNLFS